MGRRYDAVSFLSDYGTADELVGVVHAVIADIAPHARVIDLAHGIAPFDVRAGSLALARCVSYLPSGVVLGVVDPGVGTTRLAIAVEVAGGQGVLVGPDNGLLAPAVAMAGGAGRAVVLSSVDHQLSPIGATSAGRDVFAPAAGHLCNGVDLAELGDLIEADRLMPGVVPLPREEGDRLVAEVLWIDRFGNVQLNVGPDEVSAFGDQLTVTVGETNRVARIVSTYGDVSTGAVGMLIDGAGLMSLVVDRRSAADELGAAPGDQVTLAPLTDGPHAQVVASPVTMRSTRTTAAPS